MIIELRAILLSLILVFFSLVVAIERPFEKNKNIFLEKAGYNNIANALDSSNGAFVINQFQTPSSSYKYSAESQMILDSENAGGTSSNSEALSFEFFNQTLKASLVATENELVKQFKDAPLTDFIIQVKDKTIGVSVTRGMLFATAKHPHFTEEDGKQLLEKKLKGVNASSTAMKLERQILHVWAQSKAIASILKEVYESLPRELKSNTVVVVTVCDDPLFREWIFEQKRLTKYSFPSVNSKI